MKKVSLLTENGKLSIPTSSHGKSTQGRLQSNTVWLNIVQICLVNMGGTVSYMLTGLAKSSAWTPGTTSLKCRATGTCLGKQSLFSLYQPSCPRYCRLLCVYILPIINHGSWLLSQRKHRRCSLIL